MRRAVVAASLAVAACAPPPRSRVVVALPAGPATLLPDRALEEFAFSVLGNAYESLVTLDRALNVRPSLAESWYNDDDLTWVFRLREGVRLHDGRILQASAVAACLERARTHPDSRLKGLLYGVREIEARDERTVVLRTRSPDAALPSRMPGVPIWLEPRSPGGVPVGSGPYRVASFAPGREVVLEAFEGYHGPMPRVRSLEFRLIPDAEQRLALLGDGKVDLTLDVPQEAFARLQGHPRVRTLTEKGLRVLFLGMATSGDVGALPSPFRDPRLRRAVALAIDRQALTRGPLGGHADVVDQIVAPPVFGYDPSFPPLRHDPGEARRLVKEASRGDGLAVELEFMPHKYRAMETVARAIAADLGAAGIRTTLRPREPAEFFERLETHAMSLYLFGWMAFSGEAGLSYDYLVRTRGEGLGQYNGGGYSSPVVDRLLRDAAARLDSEGRRSLLHAVASQVGEDLPLVPLYRQEDLYAVARDLEFEPRIDRLIRGADLHWRP